jgi:protein involved in polysaccharide export with SLBB domain
MSINKPVRRAVVVARRSLAALAIAIVASSPSASLAEALIRVGDHVSVRVYNHADLSGDHTVDSDGTISLPLVGAVEVQGLSSAAICAKIRSRLRSYLPLVDVEVVRTAEGAPIIVTGWPAPLPDGVIKYLPGQTLAGAITSLRGGGTPAGSGVPLTPAFDAFHSRLDMRNVNLERDGRDLGPFDMEEMTSAGRTGPVLVPGDVLRFTDKPLAVAVQGAVKQPGFAHLAYGEPLSDAFDQVGGFTDSAQTGRITVEREGSAHDLPLSDEAFLHSAHAGDVLLVHIAPQVVVGGTVLHPGSVMLKGDTSLVSAVFNAGGPDKDSDLGHVHLIHDGVVTTYDVTAVAHGDRTQNPQVKDGDEVYVPHGRHVDNVVLASLVSVLRYAIFP